MNIFWLSMWPSEAARMHCDKHVRKQYLETVQMLCMAFPEEVAPYKRTKAQYNHPCSKWVRESRENFNSTLCLALELRAEYLFRFGKTHGCDPVIGWISNNQEMLYPFLPIVGIRTMPPIVMKDFSPGNEKALEFVRDNWDAAMLSAEDRWDPIVTAYRQYYIHVKRPMLTYTKRIPPDWLQHILHTRTEELHHGRVERIEG